MNNYQISNKLSMMLIFRINTLINILNHTIKFFISKLLIIFTADLKK